MCLTKFSSSWIPKIKVNFSLLQSKYDYDYHYHESCVTITIFVAPNSFEHYCVLCRNWKLKLKFRQTYKIGWRISETQEPQCLCRTPRNLCCSLAIFPSNLIEMVYVWFGLVWVRRREKSGGEFGECWKGCLCSCFWKCNLSPFQVFFCLATNLSNWVPPPWNFWTFFVLLPSLNDSHNTSQVDFVIFMIKFALNLS